MISSVRWVGIAVFGEAGEARGWPRPRIEEMGERLVLDARRRFGIQALPRP